MGKVISQRWGIPSLFLLLVVATQARDKYECGIRQLDPILLVFGGTVSQPGEWPWHVALFKQQLAKPEYLCGGSIISEHFALSAAHCFRETNPYMYFFKAGITQLYNDTDRNVSQYNAAEIIIHPKYNAGQFINDIALVRPDRTIDFSSVKIIPICLWPESESESTLLTILEEKSIGIAAGFGKTQNEEFSEFLQHTNITVFSREKCTKLLTKTNRLLQEDENKICGVGQQSTVCQGDSGGGLYISANAGDGVKWFLKGLVSFSPRKDHESGMVSTCDPDVPAFYTDVSKFRKWIDERDQIIGEQNLLKQSSCGAVRKNNSTNEVDKAVVNQYPWNVLLEYTHTKKDSKVRLYTCNGVLIHPRYVLTVGHCATGMLSKYTLTSVRVGEFNIATTEDLDASVPAKSYTSQPVDIEKILPHPQMNKPLYSNDLALIKLKHAAGIGKENVLPICLPSADEYKVEGLTLTGWKRSKSLYPKLEQDAMNISSTAQCQSQYDALQLDLPSTDDIMCARYRSRMKGRCHNYAAGSTLQYIKVVDNTPRYFLAGLMVFSLPYCRPNATEVFVKLVGSTEWIKNTILNS